MQDSPRASKLACPTLQKPAVNDAAINGNLATRARADTTLLEWTPSPSGTVWRKRVHLVGAPESGQVTSVVRYEPGAEFPAHDHPEGEEILVLEGVFSDEHGDWPAGTYLLNPEGFRHAPFSSPGCTLFVKLRQYPGKNRIHVARDTNALDWENTATPGVQRKALYHQDGFSDRMDLECWQPGACPGPQQYSGGMEAFVLEGSLADEAGHHGAGTWLRIPADTFHEPRAGSDGCTLYIKRGGLPYLRGMG